MQVLDTSTNKIFISSSKTHNYLSGPTVRFELDGLRTDRKYDITFRGINPTGKGEWSSPVSVGESKQTLFLGFITNNTLHNTIGLYSITNTLTIFLNF